jgi:hypothetical protein
LNSQTALKKIENLGHQLITDPNPEIAKVGVLLLAIPISSNEDCDDLKELIKIVFEFIKIKAYQKEAIKNLTYFASL